MRYKNASQRKTTEYNSGWCFALVNGRLAEVFFTEKFGIYGHCYVNREEYRKSEQRMIETNLKKYRFTYRNDYYFDQMRKTKQKHPPVERVFLDINKYKK